VTIKTGSTYPTYLQCSRILETLSIDPSTFKPRHVLESLPLSVHVKDLTLGDSLQVDLDTEEVARYHDHCDLEAFTVPATEYESSTTSSTPLQNEFLLPKLESLEANDSHIIGDEGIRKILMSRIDPAQRKLISSLRRVKIEFWRQEEEDIVSGIVARARGATFFFGWICRGHGIC